MEVRFLFPEPDDEGDDIGKGQFRIGILQLYYLVSMSSFEILQRELAF